MVGGADPHSEVNIMKITYSDALTMDYIAGELRGFAQAVISQGGETYRAEHPLSYEHDLQELDFAQEWLRYLVDRLKNEARKEGKKPWWKTAVTE